MDNVWFLIIILICLDEIAEAKSSFLNRMGIGHVEFDGQEIHDYFGTSSDKFAEKVYAALDHPSSCFSSRGSAHTAWFEYRLSSSKKLRKERADTTIRGSHPSRLPSSVLMAHFGLSHAAGKGQILSNDYFWRQGFLLERFKQSWTCTGNS